MDPLYGFNNCKMGILQELKSYSIITWHEIMIRIISRGTCIFVKIITNVHTHMWPLIDNYKVMDTMDLPHA